MRILIAEDEPDLNGLLKKKLEKEGYAVDACFDGEEAWEYLKMADYDAAILDIMMPRCDGLTLVKRMRHENISIPVLFLTARDTVDDKVDGLDAGGNDYLVKPFSFRELTARIRAMTRKGAANPENAAYMLADLEVDIAGHRVLRGGREIKLSSKEFAILECLVRNPGIVLSREAITQSVCSYDYEGASNMIDVYISYLRKKIDGESDQKLIHTIRGVGYVLRQEDPS